MQYEKASMAYFHHPLIFHNILYHQYMHVRALIMFTDTWGVARQPLQIRTCKIEV